MLNIKKNKKNVLTWRKHGKTKVDTIWAPSVVPVHNHTAVWPNFKHLLTFLSINEITALKFKLVCSSVIGWKSIEGGNFVVPSYVGNMEGS